MACRGVLRIAAALAVDARVRMGRVHTYVPWIQREGRKFSEKSHGFRVKDRGFSEKDRGFRDEGRRFSEKDHGFSEKDCRFSKKDRGSRDDFVYNTKVH
eukprot:361074-Chlamydomonas_euryale.AAC.7